MDKKDELLEIFVKRPHRFRLLEKGLKLAGIDKGNPVRARLMEAGCAYGDASAHVARTCARLVTGIDRCADYIGNAERIHRDLIDEGILEFQIQDIESLSFENNFFSGIFLEAAFSPLRNKESAVSELYRILKPGSRVLLNDFAVKRHNQGGIAVNASCIPCFKGVGSMEDYRGLFEEQGFREIHSAEEYGEFIALALWVGKSFNIRLDEVGAYLSKYQNAGAHAPVNCSEAGNADNISGAQLTYCQMIFEKR